MYNALQALQGRADPTLYADNELLVLSDLQRPYVSGVNSTTLRVDGCFFDFQRNATHCIQPHTTYMIGVRAIRPRGGGLLALAIASTLPKKLDTPPRVFESNTTSASRTIVLQVSRPTPLTGIIRSWRVSFTSPVEGDVTRTISIPNADQQPINTMSDDEAAATPYALTIFDLHPFVSYNFSISAVTDEGSSQPAYASASTSAGIPDQLLPPIIEYPSSDVIMVSWSPPTAATAAHIWYELRVGYATDDDMGELAYNGTQTSAELPRAQLRYDIAVRAVSSLGAGPWSFAASPSESGPAPSSSGSMTAYVTGGASAGALVLLLVAFIWHRARAADDEEEEWKPPPHGVDTPPCLLSFAPSLIFACLGFSSFLLACMHKS